MWTPAVFLLAALVIPSQALYFYIDGAAQKCFFEELPKDTLVVGHFETQVWDDHTKSYQLKPEVGVFITVEEVFDNNHRVVAQRGAGKGKLTFSAADSGEHRICFTPQNVASGGGWLSGSGIHGTVKFSLDLVIGETSKIESTDKGKIDDIVQKVRDLNSRLQDIRREQIFQREREAEFRDQSESTNARVVRWTLIQLAILGVTCAWQLSHLRAFFIKQKLT
ncbi:emp24/gp25L/p24 family/GOLD-domain-containing protein [Clohesyomyces aquaticus]|uniref:Emp24/gp25L/p24 family/GOLD-domain-containing protein n=1 Tax=Clohesyomyces aquaticus TaxID=1231657 RepID=A0A1Y1Z0Z1_9PLEO|nr:emp24/gp25L/p24 family/GOLD-domain-containing protein [Clohesyomyces aquaticus]